MLPLTEDTSPSPDQVGRESAFLLQIPAYAHALAELKQFLIGRSPMTVLTGPEGIGKLALCDYFLDGLPEEMQAVEIFNPKLSPSELINLLQAAIFESLGEASPRSRGRRSDLIAAMAQLENQQRQLLVVIEHAERLPDRVLDAIGWLLQSVSMASPVIRLVLVGQEHLIKRLRRFRHRHIWRMLSGPVVIRPLNVQETQDYIVHRLDLEPSTRAEMTLAAQRKVHVLAQGLPRHIDLICKRCLEICAAKHRHSISLAMVEQVAQELQLSPASFFKRRIKGSGALWTLLFASGVLGGALVMIVVFISKRPTPVMDKPVEGHAATRPSPTESQGRLSTDNSAPVPLGPPSLGQGAGTPAGNPAQPVEPPANSTPAADQDDFVSPQDADEGSLAFNPAIARSKTPEFLTWVKQGVEPVADVGTFSQWISQFGMDRATSKRQLMRVWVKSLPETSRIDCDSAGELGIRCVYFRGDWSLLRRINLPAILEIRREDGQLTQVLLRGEKDQLMTLRFHGTNAVFRVQDVIASWTGRATILWRAPSDTREALMDRLRGGSLGNTNSDSQQDAALLQDLLKAAKEFRGAIDASEQGSLTELDLAGAFGRVERSFIPHLDDTPEGGRAICKTVTAR